MKNFTIVKEFDSVEAATEAQDSPEFAEVQLKHIVERDAWDLTAVDFVKFYNNLPGRANTAPVKRFSDRAAGMKRILAVLNGEPEPVDETETDTQKETANMASKTKKTKTPKKTAAKKAAKPNGAAGRAPKHDDSAVLKVTKAGEDRRWQTESNRYKLFAYITKKGEVTVGGLMKYGEGELKMSTAEVRAALQKMTSDSCVKVSKGA
jgi:hypothetical protein